MTRAALALILTMTAAPAAAEPSALGKISFPTSGSAAAQPHFVRGMLLLHSFEYDDAAEAFREAQRIDPEFAMAYWGEALSYTHLLWSEQFEDKGRAVLQRLGPTPEARAAKAPTQREKDYLAAVEILYGPGDDPAPVLAAYSKAMGRLSETYPEDDEARVLHALSILATNVANRQFSVDARAAAIAEEVFARNPEHPGALHYLIHAYDSPMLAPLGLRAAKRYGRIASGAAHALHMTSHIFFAMGMWDEAVKANEESWAASAERVRRKQLGVDDNGFHAYLWLAYAYLQQGRRDDARRVLEHTEALARQGASRRTSYHYAYTRAAWIVETRQRDGFPPVVTPELTPVTARAAELSAEGLAAAAAGRVDEASRIAGELSAAIRSATGSEGHHGKRTSLSLAEREGLKAMLAQVEGLTLVARGRKDEGLARLREAAAIEDAMPYEYGPPYPVKPAHELLGEVLLDLKQPGEARREFEAALRRAPNRRLSLEALGRIDD